MTDYPSSYVSGFNWEKFEKQNPDFVTPEEQIAADHQKDHQVKAYINDPVATNTTGALDSTTPGVPEFNWASFHDTPDLSFIWPMFLVCGSIFLFRLSTAIVGLYWSCTAFWFIMLMFKNGLGALLINPLFCIFAPMCVGGVTYLVIVIAAEFLRLPGALYGKITR